MTKRNYEVDFLKLVFSVFVVIHHSTPFIPKGSGIILPAQLGWWCVHFFFTVSGFLMVSSFIKHPSPESGSYGKNALRFVFQKFAKIGPEYVLSILFCIAAYLSVSSDTLYAIWHTEKAAEAPVTVLPELLGFPKIFFWTIEINTPVWYISAMLVSMLLLYYMLQKNKDFFLYVFSPLAALLIYGFSYNNEGKYIFQYQFNGFFNNGILRAICGLCFGAVSYLIYDLLKKSANNKAQKLIITIAEAAIYGLIFIALLMPGLSVNVKYSIMLLLPIALAISFSEASYFSTLFKSKAFHYCNTWSLAIYLNHWVALALTKQLFPNQDYAINLLLTFAITIIISAVNIILSKAVRLIWNKKLKEICLAFTKE